MIFPNKKQYRRWTLPSRLTLWGFVLTILTGLSGVLFWYWPHSSNQFMEEDLTDLIDIVNVVRILEGSPLCCEIKTAEVVLILPMEGEITLSAETFIGLIPDTTDQSDLRFSFSIDHRDSQQVFDCSMVGKTDLNIYFFRRNKVFCAKPAIMDLRDPDENCLLIQSKKGKKQLYFPFRRIGWYVVPG